MPRFGNYRPLKKLHIQKTTLDLLIAAVAKAQGIVEAPADRVYFQEVYAEAMKTYADHAAYQALRSQHARDISALAGPLRRHGS